MLVRGGQKMLSIRKAGADDVPLLKTLIYEFADFYHLPVSITEEQLLRDGFGSRPIFRVLIAEWGGEAAGYAVFFDYYSSFHGPCIFLEDLFIRDQFRSKGIGKAFFVQLAAMAQRGGCFGIMLNVFDWNHPAVKFYKSLGATFWDDLKVVCLNGPALEAIASEAANSESANRNSG